MCRCVLMRQTQLYHSHVIKLIFLVTLQKKTCNFPMRELTEVRRRSQRSEEVHIGQREVIGILQIQRELVEVRLSSQRSDGGHRG